MPAAAKPSKSASPPDNALARKAIEAIEQIDREAQEKKASQLEGLKAAKAAIRERIDELNHQLQQVDDAITSIRGKPAHKERRTRRNLDAERERVLRWMSGRKGQKFAPGGLVREFPELDGVVMSVFLKPLTQNGKMMTDTSEGIRRTKYYVSE